MKLLRRWIVYAMVTAAIGFTLCGCAQSGLMTRPQPSGLDDNYAAFLSAAKSSQHQAPESWNPVKKARFEEALETAESLKPGHPEIAALRNRFQQAMAVWRIRADRRATEARKAFPETFVNSVGITMKLIQPGSVSSVEITTPYYTGVYEVTEAQWARVMGGSGGDEPANWVSYETSREFCQRLSAKEGITYSLPSEDQWEYACRAGTTTEYSFGDDWDEAASRQPNAWGLYDMHGNLWELCFGCGRGGSWDCFSSAACSSTYRHKFPPDQSGWSMGFRVVVELGLSED